MAQDIIARALALKAAEEGKVIRLIYSDSADPTSADIDAYVRSKGYTEDKFGNINVTVSATGIMWYYYEDTHEWKPGGTSSVDPFDQETLGLIKGKEEDGYVFHDASDEEGLGKVSGWDNKQDKLPEGLNGQILHKNDATGEIEWITVEFPYSAPTISQLVLRGEGTDLSSSYEFGGPVSINGIKHTETNISNIVGDLTLKDGGTVLASNIVKTASSVVVLLAAPIPLDGQHGGKTLTLSGTNTRSATFSKTASVSFSDYDYCQFAGDATIPTSGASLSATTKGGTFNVTYVAGKCIRFITQKTSGTIQQSVLGTWTDVDTTDEGTVTFIQKNGFSRTYHVFRTDFYAGSGTGSYKFN